MLDAAAELDVLAHRLAQLADALGLGVGVPAVAQCLAAGLDDVLGRLEVRRTDAEVHDGASLGLQLLGSREHLEGGLGAELVHALGELQGG